MTHLCITPNIEKCFCVCYAQQLIDVYLYFVFATGASLILAPRATVSSTTFSRSVWSIRLVLIPWDGPRWTIIVRGWSIVSWPLLCDPTKIAKREVGDCGNTHWSPWTGRTLVEWCSAKILLVEKAHMLRISNNPIAVDIAMVWGFIEWIHGTSKINRQTCLGRTLYCLICWFGD